jgi:preprotein translocase subunit SecE
MAKVVPLMFIKQVRNEVYKVTWTSRNETTLTSVIVIIFAIIASLFFFLSDQVMSFFIRLILGLGS